MKKLLIALLVIALIGSSDSIYACGFSSLSSDGQGFYKFSSDPKNVDMHGVQYSYREKADQPLEKDLIELSPGQSFYSLGMPVDITVKVIANGDVNNTRSCNVFISPLGDVDVRPAGGSVSANVTAQCPDVSFNSKTCELTLTDVSN